MDNSEIRRYGVWVARRAWLEPSAVLNTLPWPELTRWRAHRVRPAQRRRA